MMKAVSTSTIATTPYSRFDLNVVCEKKESRTINCVEQNKCGKIFIFIDTFIYRKLYKPEVHNVESSDHCQQLHLEGNNFIHAKWGGTHQSDQREVALQCQASPTFTYFPR